MVLNVGLTLQVWKVEELGEEVNKVVRGLQEVWQEVRREGQELLASHRR